MKEGLNLNRLRELRKEQGLTLDQVAKANNIANATISRYEHGVQEPKLWMWEQLANFFHVTPQYLVGWTDDPRA